MNFTEKMNNGKANDNFPQSQIPGFIMRLNAFNFINLGLINACLFFMVPLCSLPPARMGYYRQIETSVILFWFLAGLAGLWLYGAVKKYTRLVNRIFQFPVVWGPILLGVLTIILSVFHSLPFRDFIGPAQMGEGALTFIASGIVAAQFSMLMRITSARRIILAIAFIIGVLICGLTIIGSQESPFPGWQYWNWSPFFFPDFLAFIIIAVFGSYLYVRNSLINYKIPCDILAVFLCGTVTYYTSNKSLTYGWVISALVLTILNFLPNRLKQKFIHLCFFGLSVFFTFLISFYDDFSLALPENLKFLGNIHSLVSRTWLSKVTFIELWHEPLTWNSLKGIFIGHGWGTFGNVSTSNMFLIPKVGLFTGNNYDPTWELVNRDLLHTHNVLTNLFHSAGVLGIAGYLYTQYKLVNSISKTLLKSATAFLIAYQIQVLFWFQFLMTIPFTILAFTLFFRTPAPCWTSRLVKPAGLKIYGVLLIIFSGLQGWVTTGYNNNLMNSSLPSTPEKIEELVTSSYGTLEAAFGAQRQVALARIYGSNLQKEFENAPEKVFVHSLKLVRYLKSLPVQGNYLANNVALNIMSEIALRADIRNMEDSDTLIPFFNFCQKQGKNNIVLDISGRILERNSCDPVALWFRGSSQMNSSSHFEEGMCQLQKAINNGIERFMPVSETLKSKIAHHSRFCPDR
jgi:hypothetical protein